MDEEELKRIHGEDVELKPDDTEDEKLTEEQALKDAREQGIEFIDTFFVQDHDGIYDSREEAEAAMSKLKIKGNIIQTRRRK